MESGGLSGSADAQAWQAFLKKYGFGHDLITRPGQIDSQSSGVLILPSAVALSAAERQAIVDFRARGGSVLVTYLSGVRDERGNWLGFEFMRQELDVNVVGTIAQDRTYSFLFPYGDSPVSHHLPAGERVWIERPNHWSPLRLEGKQYGADILDWGRTVVKGKPTGAIVFDERQLQGNASSRTVALGFPERIWQSADARQIDSIVHASLSWLMRSPQAYLAAWPAPYQSAIVVAMHATESMNFGDVVAARKMQSAGVSASYYVLSEQARISAPRIKEVSAMGHEVSELADRFDVMRGLTRDQQARRLATMLREMTEAGFSSKRRPSFVAPIGAIDKITQELLIERQFDHYLASSDHSEARLPVLHPTTTNNGQQGTVLLPITSRGPDEASEDGDIDASIQTYIQELDLAQRMGSLSVVRISNNTYLSAEDLERVVQDLKRRKSEAWLAKVSEVVDWWRERARVNASLMGNRLQPELTVFVADGGPLKSDVAVWINLPSLNSQIEPLRNGQLDGSIRIVRIDRWRSAVVLKGLRSGEHRWQIRFK